METSVREIDYQTIETIADPERFVYMYSRCYEEITGFSIRDAYSFHKTNLIEGFLKITNEFGKPIYRRFKGCNKDSKSVYLGYRSMCELGLHDGDLVFIEPTSWFKYLIHNSDSYIRYTVVLAIVGVVCSVLSCILAIIQLVFCCG